MASFKKHSTGWEYRFKYKDPFTQKWREKSERGFRTKQEAELAAAEARNKIKRGFGQEDIRLSDYLTLWLEEYKRGTIRDNTFEIHRHNIEYHIKPYFENINLSSVMPEMYQEFLNHLHDKGYSRRTVEIIHATMNSALNKAVILRKIEFNPCTGATIKGERKPRNIKFLDTDDIPKFLLAAREYGYIYWMFFRAQIGSGIRKGEAAAVTITDLDLENRRIWIDKTYDFRTGKVGKPKTENSERWVYIDQALAKDLERHLQWIEQNKATLGPLYKSDLNLLFCKENGDFIPKSSLFNAFSRILKRAGLPSLPIHSLRHTYTVMALEAGADIKFVQEQLGHGSSQITMDVYSHISRKLGKRNVGVVDEYVDAIFGGNLGATEDASHVIH